VRGCPKTGLGEISPRQGHEWIAELMCLSVNGAITPLGSSLSVRCQLLMGGEQSRQEAPGRKLGPAVSFSEPLGRAPVGGEKDPVGIGEPVSGFFCCTVKPWRWSFRGRGRLPVRILAQD